MGSIYEARGRTPIPRHFLPRECICCQRLTMTRAGRCQSLPGSEGTRLVARRARRILRLGLGVQALWQALAQSPCSPESMEIVRVVCWLVSYGGVEGRSLANGQNGGGFEEWNDLELPAAELKVRHVGESWQSYRYEILVGSLGSRNQNPTSFPDNTRGRRTWTGTKRATTSHSSPSILKEKEILLSERGIQGEPLPTPS